MTSLAREEYFSAIEKLLEKREIVTFKWLSRKFNIHNSVAKQLLDDFAKDKLNDEKYSVTFSIFGKTKDGELAIWLSKEDSTLFCDTDFTIIDKYVFSIERTPFDFDFLVIYNEDKLTYQFDQINLSSINYPTKIDRRASKPSVTNRSPGKKEEIKSVAPSQKIIEKIVCKDSLREKSKPPNKIISLLTTSKNKSNGKKDQESTDTQPNDNRPLTTNVANYKPTDSRVKTTILTCKKESDEITTKKEVKITVSTETASKIEENSKKKISERVKSKNKPPKKKMKRILTPLDSSSDSENSHDDPFIPDEEPELEPEVLIKSEPSITEPTTVVTVHGKKRKRKVIEKTVAGDDGFFYTEKEVVYVSCDSDEENNQNENVSTNKRTKVDDTKNEISHVNKIECKTLVESNTKSQKSKMKQSSIVNFFKKPL